MVYHVADFAVYVEKDSDDLENESGSGSGGHRTFCHHDHFDHVTSRIDTSGKQIPCHQKVYKTTWW